MTPGFQRELWSVETSDGRNFGLLEPELFVDYDHTIYLLPKGATSNGGSIPPLLWGPPFNLPPFGRQWKSYFLHDNAFENILLILLPDGRTVPANKSFNGCNDLLWNAMKTQGVPPHEMRQIITGVKIGGREIFAKCRRKA